MKRFLLMSLFVGFSALNATELSCFEVVGNLAISNANTFILSSGQNNFQFYIQDGELPQYSTGVTLKVVFEKMPTKELHTRRNRIDIQRRFLATSEGYLKEIKLKKGQKCI